MKIVVLLSAARHPVSARPVLARLEAQAIGLAKSLGASVTGVHAGPDLAGLDDAFGQGLTRLDHVKIDAEADPVPALAEFLRERSADLVLAGRRGQGGRDTGLVPYALADLMDRPLVADAIALETGAEDGTLRVDASLPKGARRRVTVRLPTIVTVHPLSPAPAPFVFAASRQGDIRRHGGAPEAPEASADETFAERPYRARPKLMRKASATADAGESVHVRPEPDEAARLILDYLETNGIRRY